MIGTPSLSTNQKREPSGAPFTTGSAIDGLSVENGFIVLGEQHAAPTGAATLIDDRLVPMDTFLIKWAGIIGGQQDVNLFFNDAPGGPFLENDFANSPVPQPEVGYRIRTNPSFNPPFDLTFLSELGLRNTGETYLRATDGNAVPNASIAITFELENPLGITGVTEVGRFNTDGTFGVGTPAPFAQIHSLLNSPAGASLLALENQTGNANSSADLVWINDTTNTAVMKLHSSNHVFPNQLDIDNSNLVGNILIDSGGTAARVRADGLGIDILTGGIKTDAPTAGVSAAGYFNFGAPVVAASVLDGTRYLEVSRNGVLLKLALIA